MTEHDFRSARMTQHQTSALDATDVDHPLFLLGAVNDCFGVARRPAAFGTEHSVSILPQSSQGSKHQFSPSSAIGIGRLLPLRAISCP